MRRLLNISWFLIVILFISTDGYSQDYDIRKGLENRAGWVLQHQEDIHEFIRGYYRTGTHDSVLYFANRYYGIAEDAGDDKKLADALYFVGMGQSRLDLVAFKSTAETLVNLGSQLDEAIYVARGYKYISDYYSSIGNADSSIFFLKEAEESALSDRNFDSDSLLQVLVGQFRHNIASGYYRQQMFDEAIEVALNNRNYAISIGEEELEMRTYQILSAAYSALVSYATETGAELDTELYLDRSEEFAKLFVASANKSDNDYIKGFAYATLANMYSMREKLDSALVNYEHSLVYARSQKDYRLYSSRLNNIGSIHTRLGQLEMADIKYNESYMVAVDINNEILQARSANNIAYNALQLNNLNRARQFALISIELGEKLGRYGTLSQGYGNLSDIETQSSNPVAALEAYKSHIQYRDSLLKEENLQRIEDLQAKYETEKKEAEIELLQNQSELQAALIQTRNSQIIVVALVLLLIAAGIYLAYQRRLDMKQKELQDSNQRLLSVQMNPHFLFNALVSIQSFVLQNKEAKDTSNFVAKFAKVTRMVLNYSREHFITLEQELDLLNEFLRLQQIRTNNKFDYHFHLDESINPSAVLLPPMLAQPFIENAVEHGILPMQDERGSIEVSVKRKGDLLLISVQDNGAGFKHGEETTNKKSLAIKITGERFELLRKITGKPFSFDISSNPKNTFGRGVSVEFKVPVFT